MTGVATTTMVMIKATTTMMEIDNFQISGMIISQQQTKACRRRGPNSLLFLFCAGSALGFLEGLPKSRYKCSESALPAEELEELLDLELAELDRDWDLEREDVARPRLLEPDLLDDEWLLTLFGLGL